MRLLIVDDEPHIANGLKRTVEAFDPPLFADVITAYGVRQARTLMEAQAVDVLLCDIEMPRENGFALVEWVKAAGLPVVHLFLTSHAVFDYANRALRLQSLDYLLKPVSADELHRALEKAVEGVQKLRVQPPPDMGLHWQRSREPLAERFWRAVGEGSIACDTESLASEGYMFPPGHFGPRSRFCPMLAKLTPDVERQTGWEQGLLRFAFRNMAQELLFEEADLPAMPALSDFLYLCVPALTDTAKLEDFLSRCVRLAEGVRMYLPAHLFLYVHGVTEASGIPDALKALRACEAEMLSPRTSVVCLQETGRCIGLEGVAWHVVGSEQPSTHSPGKAAGETAWKEMADWLERVETEGGAAPVLELTRMLEVRTRKAPVSRGDLQQAYYNIQQALGSFLSRNEVQAHRLFRSDDTERLSTHATDTVDGLVRWAQHVMDAAQRLVIAPDPDQQVVARVRRHIRAHLSEPLTRNDLAAAVFLTPDHLTHVFKQVTGMTLTGYLQEERIQHARRLLVSTQMSVADIAFAAGYTSVSHFTQVFRRHTGVTPLDYRRNQGAGARRLVDPDADR